ncbi:MAG: M23 family metallopeptidase [Patescibacteria group bacterium]|jgi:murein DD-endopeptidase MepM/ murein hydrolase activator NlpD
MEIKPKYFFIKLLLSVLRGFVFLKQNAWAIFTFLGRPFSSIGRFSFKWIGLPIYRLLFFFRRQMYRLYLPAKNRFLFVFTNRYMFHAAIVLVVAVTGVVNIQTSEVRAETFGAKSLILSLMDENSSTLVEEVSAERVIPHASSSYLDTYSVSSEEIDVDLLYEEQVATLLGGSAITSPTISEGGNSVAARNAIEEYTVQDGDVLGSIAEKYGLSLSTLLWANNLTYRSTIRLGQKIIIPPADGVVYTVKRGDTVSSIAKKYGTSTDKILSFNDLSDSAALSVGVTLMLPDATPPTSTPVTYTAPASSIFTGTRGSTAPAAATGSWVWPTDGCYITVYFNQYYRFGLHKGLDIDGDYSSYVYATRGGTVTRSGWFDGYGNCVDINHGDGYVTRYGHFSKLFVAVGQEVAAGEALGNVGTTGQSTGTHLHFEVMENSVKLNPLNFIRCK